MNRDINYFSELGNSKLDHLIGEQPRKSASKKAKDGHTFKKFTDELEEVYKDRDSYKRASTKNLTRVMLRSGKIKF